MTTSELKIDTSQSNHVRVQLGKIRLAHSSNIRRSQSLLGLIDKALTRAGVSPREISKISFNPGPGSFTGLKVGAAVANCFGMVLGIPVNNKNVRQNGPAEPNYQKN